MVSLTVRDIDQTDYDNLRRLARENNRSTSAQVRAMIAAANRQDVTSQEAVDRLREFQRKAGLALPRDKGSLDFLREERDSW